MKALSLIQPWASLIAIGAKRIETRSWRTSYRGPIAIHASKGFPGWARDTCDEEPFYSVLTRAGLLWPMGDETLTHQARERYLTIPLSAIVAVAYLSDVDLAQRIDDAYLVRAGCPPHERDFGDYAPGRVGWLLGAVKRLSEPIPCTGARGLWDVPADIARQLEAL